jgi:carboxypeptidase Q
MKCIWRRRTTLLCCSVAVLCSLAAFDLASTVRATDKTDGAKAAPANAAGTSSAQAIDQKLIDIAAHSSEVMKNLTYISDMIGARLTGSKNLTKASNYTLEKMKEYGLVNVHLEPWTIPVGWERGDISARMVEPDNGVRLSLASMAWTPGTKGRVTADVVIVKATNQKELDAYKGKLKNAVVLMRPPSRIAPLSNMNMFGGNRNRGRRAQRQGRNGQPTQGQPGRNGRRGRGNFAAMRQFRTTLNKFLADEGAVGIFTDAGKPHMLLNMTGTWRPTLAECEKQMPTYFVAHEHYAMLYRLASLGRTRISLDAHNKFIPGPITIYNTVGDIRGSEKPDEVVICGGHLDSWDLGQGSTDNGTGACVSLEAARVIAKSGIKPKRTIRFIMFTGEEEGLKGSAEYVKAHKDEMAKVSMALVNDTGTGKCVGLGLMGQTDLKPILEPLAVSLKPLGFTEFNPTRMGATDHASFDRAGVAAFWFVQDPAEYRLTHHSQSDTLDKAIPADLIQSAQCMAVLAMRVADLPEMLPHHKVQERRGFRRAASAR